jgi:cell division protein FtsW
MFIFYKIDYQKLSRFSFFLLIGAFILLILTLTSPDPDHRALVIGKMKIQTFYFVGFLVIFFIAKYIASRANKGEELSLKEFAVLVGILSIFCVAIFIGNFSTALILFVTAIVVFFVSNIKGKYLAGVILLFVLAGMLVMNTERGRAATVRGRFDYYMAVKTNKEITPELADYGRQMALAKAAIARSAWTPAGPGHGIIKKKMSENDTDFVYVTVVEETGIIIGVLIILLYLILFFRTMQIARRSEGYFGRILAVGIGFWITCQALVHIGVNCELIPATGQTLPLISKGGASLLFSGIIIGMLLNISKNKQYNDIE